MPSAHETIYRVIKAIKQKSDLNPSCSSVLLNPLSKDLDGVCPLDTQEALKGIAYKKAIIIISLSKVTSSLLPIYKEHDCHKIQILKGFDAYARKYIDERGDMVGIAEIKDKYSDDEKLAFCKQWLEEGNHGREKYRAMHKIRFSKDGNKIIDLILIQANRELGRGRGKKSPKN